jgi:membrane-associated phospholipid phosphatase
MSFTALVTAQLVGASRWLRIALWTWLGLTLVATVYLGWHYVVDDIAGIAIGAASLVLARLLTGFDPRSASPPPAVPIREEAAERERVATLTGAGSRS